MLFGEQEGRDALAEVARNWNAAATPWNPASLSAVYTPDALLLGGRPGHAVGRVLIRQYFDSYIGEIAGASLQLTEQHLVGLPDSRYLAQGYGHFTFDLADGAHTASVVRTTLLLIGPAPWRIQVQHVSPSPTSPPLGR